jgi:hypothetical protein
MAVFVMRDEETRALHRAIVHNDAAVLNTLVLASRKNGWIIGQKDAGGKLYDNADWYFTEGPQKTDRAPFDGDYSWQSDAVWEPTREGESHATV